MRAALVLRLSVWHFRASRWHFNRGEALYWKSFAYTDPKDPWKWTGAEKTFVASVLGIGIAALWLWFVWRAW